jgi:hypothetical protein
MAGLVAFFALLSLLVIILGLVALARGHLDWARIRSRRAAGVLTGAALVLLVVCVALTPADADHASVTASPPSASASPSSDPAETPSATRTTSTKTTAATTFPPQPTTASPVVQAPVPAPAASTAPVSAAPAPVAPVPPPPMPAGPRAGCDPSYPDVCLHDGIGDYDCAGGRGNGPNYVRGPLRVLPPDPFDLDRDGNGTGCQT